MSIQAEIQDAVYQLLTGSAEVMAIAKGVYDNPGQLDNINDPQAYPIITISESSAVPWDDFTGTGLDMDLVVHTWSRASHGLEVKNLQDVVFSTLHRATMVINSGNVVNVIMTNMTAQKDPDGVTVHGVQSFNILIAIG